MVSLIDALFIMPTALFAVAFIVPALIMSTGTGEEFRQATSIGMADTVAQSFTMAFLQAEKNNNSNLRQAAEVMSGRQRAMNRRLLRDHPEMFSYLKVSFDSPVTSNCGNIPGDFGGVFNPKNQGPDPCDFYFEGYGAKQIDKRTHHFRIPVPVRGGNSGVMDVAYQVE